MKKYLFSLAILTILAILKHLIGFEYTVLIALTAILIETK